MKVKLLFLVGLAAMGVFSMTALAASEGMILGWKKVAPSPQARFEAQGAAVGDRLYVFGGYVSFPCCTATSRSDVYDHTTDTWTRIAGMPEKITHAPAVVAGEDIYLLGGFVGDHPGPSTTHVWKYDTASDKWSTGPPLPERRGAGGGAIVGRTIHYFGGVDRPTGQNVYVDEAEHWALDLNEPVPTWEPRAPLPNPRNHMSAAVLDGKIYAVGGQLGGNEKAGNQSTVAVYNPATDRWARVADLPRPRGHLATVVLDGRLYAIGGSLDGVTRGLPADDVTAYDPLIGRWKTQTPLPAPRKTPVADAIGGRIVSSTGNGGGKPTATTWVGTQITCTMTGTSGNDVLEGTESPDVVCGLGGSDTIKGLGGDDTLAGGAGDDKLLGGKGDDTLNGGTGTDTGSYSASLAAVTASLANGSATGEGSDAFVGIEDLLGSSKADTLTGSDANNTLTGGGGNDTERGGAGADRVIGSNGADSLFGQDGPDAVNSRDDVSRNDSLNGGAGTDTKTTDATERSVVGFP